MEATSNWSAGTLASRLSVIVELTVTGPVNTYVWPSTTGISAFGHSLSALPAFHDTGIV